MTIFDLFKDIIKEKRGHLIDDPQFFEVFNLWMVVRWLSMREDLIPYAQWLNKYGSKMTIENCYHYLLVVIPRQNNYFIKYIKKSKKK